MMHRHNSTFLGSFQGKELMGFKSQFTFAYPEGELPGLFPVKKGVGLNPKCPFEGIHYRNFFGTYLFGAAAGPDGGGPSHLSRRV